jgi:hypothetical protein
MPGSSANAAATGPSTATPLGPEFLGASSPSPVRSESSPWWRFGFPAAIVVGVVALVVLSLIGRELLLTTTDGRRLTDVTDPSLPGWEAITEPTPTLLVAQIDADEGLVAVTVLVLTGEGVGSVVLVPASTAVKTEDDSLTTLALRYQSEGLDALQAAVGAILGTGMGDAVTVDAKAWADLVAPVAPLSVDNPDAVTGADGTTIVFPKGTISLKSTEVGSFLALARVGSDEVNRLTRHQAFWKAWLNNVAASANEQVVPGETETGLGRFVRTLAVARVDYQVLPVRRVEIPGSDVVVYAPETEQVANLIAVIVPFPVGAPPGSRARVRVLDGTGTLDHGLPAAPLVVQAGGQVDQIGNATSFDIVDTQIVYYDDARKVDAEAMREALGVGTVLQSVDQGDAVDLTIILGADYAANPKSVPPVSSAPITSTTTGTAVPGTRGPGG